MTANLRSDGGSFKDSAGRVYRVCGESGDERILRGLDQAAAATLEKLLGEPFFEVLVAGGQVVPTRMLDPAGPDAKDVLAAGWSAVAEHEPVDFRHLALRVAVLHAQGCGLAAIAFIGDGRQERMAAQGRHAVQCAVGRHAASVH